MKRIIPLLTVLVATSALTAVLVLKSNADHRVQLAQAREELATVKAQLQSQHELIEPLRVRLDNLEARPQNPSFTGRSNAETSALDATLTRLLTELTTQRALLAQLVGGEAGMKLIETAEQTKERVQAGLVVLETRAAEIIQKERMELDKLDRLRTELNVPDEVASLEPEKAMLESRYAAYRPFFEQRRVFVETQRFSQILRMKIATEKVDINLPRSR